MPRPGKPASKPGKKANTAQSARPDFISKELSLLRDEVRSLGETVRSLEKKVIWCEFNTPRSHDIEVIKSELRLIRSDISRVETRLAPAVAEERLTAVEAK